MGQHLQMQNAGCAQTNEQIQLISHSSHISPLSPTKEDDNKNVYSSAETTTRQTKNILMKKKNSKQKLKKEEEKTKRQL